MEPSFAAELEFRGIWSLQHRGSGIRAAQFFGKAVGVPTGEAQQKFIAAWFHRFQGKLGDVIELVLQIDVEIIRREESGCLIQDFEQGGGVETVIEILGDPALQATNGIGAEGAAAINKLFINQSDFGDVGVCCDLLAVRQGKADIEIGMLCEVRFKFS
jgi:hypothetical protein